MQKAVKQFCQKNIKQKRFSYENLFCYVGDDLSLREAALQLLSARVSLTTVFGKGTGGPSA